MSHLTLGLICGIAFGAVAVATMLPLSFPDKRAALTSAFINRFSIGLAIGVTSIPGPGWATGLGWGLLLSTPAAIITRRWGPILGIGAVGGAIIGVVIQHFAPGIPTP